MAGSNCVGSEQDSVGSSHSSPYFRRFTTPTKETDERPGGEKVRVEDGVAVAETTGDELGVGAGDGETSSPPPLHPASNKAAAASAAMVLRAKRMSFPPG